VSAAAVVRDAVVEERRALEELQRRASLVWEADREMLLAHPDAIELPVEQIQSGWVRVAVDDAGRPLGFSVLLAVRAGACELDGLFVEPEEWGRGIGRLLVSDCVARALRAGASRIEVTANPDAYGFYSGLGFVAGEIVPTRFRPARRMRLSLLASDSRAGASRARH
jgi:GNAT superfamily N-acetyltransferase